MKGINLPEAAALLDLSDDVVIEHGITAVSYIDKDGKQNYAWTIHGEPLTSTTLGLMVIVEHSLAQLVIGPDA